MYYDFTSCTLCPRHCSADRVNGVGACGVSEHLRVARAALHMWEEPCISGEQGSGTVFFSGCPLGCVYCQNREISSGCKGKEITVGRLAGIFGELEAAGANNLNLVSPTQFTPQIITALELAKPKIPVVWNTGGYESVETIEMLAGYVDIYLADFKYADTERAAKYSGAPDYPERCTEALLAMQRQVGKPVYGQNKMLQRGLVVRHLVLPGGRQDGIAVLHKLSEMFAPDDFIISIMNQYVPYPYCPLPLELNRKLTRFEYSSVTSEAINLGMTGFTQSRSSAVAIYTPEFDFSGV